LPAASFNERIGESAQHVPIGIGRPDHLACDDPQGRSPAVSTDDRLDPAAAEKLHAARDHRLLRFRSSLGVEDLKLNAISLEHTGALTEFRNGSVPQAPLGDSKLEQFESRCRLFERQHRHDQ
jgi:hypothetical protein